MSRRQRRKSRVPTQSKRSKTSKSKKASKGLWLKMLVGVVVVLMVSGAIGYFKVREYLHSVEFRELVSDQVSDELGMAGSFDTFNWDGLSGSTLAYKASGQGALQTMEVEDINLEVDLNFMKRDVFKLKDVKVEKINGTIDLNHDFIRVERQKTERGFWASFLPEEVELINAKVQDLNAQVITSGSNYSAEGVITTIEKHKQGQGFDIKLEGGKFKVPFSIIESAYLKEANLKLRGNEVYLNHSAFTVQGSGELELNGFVDLGTVSSKRYEIEGKLSNLLCKDVFPPDWQKNLKGEVISTFSVEPYRDGLPLMKGHIDIKNGRLEALPVLNKIAYYLADPIYRTIKFQKFACDFEKYEEKVILRNVILSSKGVLKIEGNITFDGRKIEGQFSVGLPPEKLRNIPGAETMVFSPGKERMNWTQVRIWGTTDDLEEDLTGRLIEAAGQRMIVKALEIGGEVMNPERVKQASDIVGKGIGEGVKVLQGDKSLLEGINGFLGSDQEKTEEKEKLEEEKKRAEEPEKSETENEEEEILPNPLPVDPRKIPDLLPF